MERFGDKVLTGKRTGDAPGLCRCMGRCHRALVTWKREEEDKRGTQLLWEVVDSHQSWVWNISGYGNSDYDL